MCQLYATPQIIIRTIRTKTRKRVGSGKHRHWTIVAKRTVHAKMTKPIDQETKISVVRDRAQMIAEALICSSSTKNLLSKINVQSNGNVSKMVLRKSRRPVVVPRSWNDEAMDENNVERWWFLPVVEERLYNWKLYRLNRRSSGQQQWFVWFVRI